MRVMRESGGKKNRLDESEQKNTALTYELISISECAEMMKVIRAE